MILGLETPTALSKHADNNKQMCLRTSILAVLFYSNHQTFSEHKCVCVKSLFLNCVVQRERKKTVVNIWNKTNRDKKTLITYAMVNDNKNNNKNN